MHVRYNDDDDGFALVPYFSILGFQELGNLVPNYQAT
jgi:hypothetical protein